MDFHTSDDSTTLSIELTDEGFTSQFLAFLHDLILNTSKMDKHAAGLHFISRLEDWAVVCSWSLLWFKRVTSPRFTRELEVLRSLLEKVSSKVELIQVGAVLMGTGRISDGESAESKLRPSVQPVSGIQISSADQLADNPGRLFLYVQYLNAGDHDGASINEVIDDIHKMLQSDQAATDFSMPNS